MKILNISNQNMVYFNQYSWINDYFS
jgi:hypothetical protein